MKENQTRKKLLDATFLEVYVKEDLPGLVAILTMNGLD